MARGRTPYLPVMVVAAVLVACSVALLAFWQKEAQAAFPGKNGRIAFDAYASERASPTQIFTINPDGTGERQLTHSSSVYNSSPSYSPEGTKIAFGNDREGRHIGAPGKKPTYPTRPSAAGRTELRPDWGPRPTGQ